jgi:hypothetical protein
MDETIRMNLREVAAQFDEPQKCYGHCDQPATLKILGEKGGMLLATMACHAGYVSRIMAYGTQIDLPVFRSFISDSLGGSIRLTDDDLRTATRFSWDLGMSGQGADEVVKVAYWTQNYRGSKSEATDRQALFACANCGSLYIQHVSAKSVLCPNCKAG